MSAIPPEPPDFDKIARFLLNLTPGSGLAGTHLTQKLIVEQLSQVWNARGAADANLCAGDDTDRIDVLELIRTLDR